VIPALSLKSHPKDKEEVIINKEEVINNNRSARRSTSTVMIDCDRQEERPNEHSH
jgi:hypothetical protein